MWVVYAPSLRNDNDREREAEDGLFLLALKTSGSQKLTSEIWGELYLFFFTMIYVIQCANHKDDD